MLYRLDYHDITEDCKGNSTIDPMGATSLNNVAKTAPQNSHNLLKNLVYSGLAVLAILGVCHILQEYQKTRDIRKEE